MTSPEFDKIDTLFNRDEQFRITSDLRNPVYESFKTWHVTKKIDGTNVRVMLSPEGAVTVGGRTDAAQMPTDLVRYLYETFTPEKMKSLWLPDDKGVVTPVSITLYGEGYGPGIQKGGGVYREDKAFRLFDVLVNGTWWLTWENVEDVARKLGIKTAPNMGEMTLEEIIELVKKGFPSIVAKEESGKEKIAEGVVGRTIEPLFDRRGKRIILKLKTSDFPLAA